MRQPTSQQCSLQALAGQLEKLSSWPNPFQSHAKASLRLLGRQQVKGCWPCRRHDPAFGVETEQRREVLLDGKDKEVPDDDCQLNLERRFSAPTVFSVCTSIGEDSAPRSSVSQRLVARSMSDDASSNEMVRKRSGEQWLYAGTTVSCFTSKALTMWPKEVVRLFENETKQHLQRHVQSRPWACPGDAGNSSRGCSPESRANVGAALRLRCGSKQIPHPRKTESGGEDSLFICPEGSAIGIADGVGEWEWRFGLNPRAFADELMAGACAAGERTPRRASLPASERAMTMLEEGYRATRSFGSATALVAALSSTAELGVANLGDSGLRVLRWHIDSGHYDAGASPEQPCFRVVRIVHRTVEQQHSFNCPYQLARLPGPEDFARLRAEGRGKLVRAVQSSRSAGQQDTPSSANLYSFKVQPGDLVLLGSDGAFDNLHDHEICELAGLAVSPMEASENSKPQWLGPSDPERIAATIAWAAHHRSQDTTARTPFALSAKEAGLSHVGGKPDDISVVAAWVVTA